MGRSKPVEIAGLSFPTTEAFKEHVRGLLHQFQQGHVIGEPHHSFLCQLVKRHPEAAEKIGPGIKHFKVISNYVHRTPCFCLVRTDGTFTDFSYMKCITPPTPWREYVDALRCAVADQIIEAREEAFGFEEEIRCPLQGILMTRNMTHVDHVPPDTFSVLVERFNDEEWIHEADPPGTTEGDNESGRQLVDKGLEERWRYFHKVHAKLRVISREAHQAVTTG